MTSTFLDNITSHEQMMDHFHGNLILCCKLCLTIKIVIIVKVLLGRMCKHQVEKVLVAEHGLGKASNSDGTFNILNQEWLSLFSNPDIPLPYSIDS